MVRCVPNRIAYEQGSQYRESDKRGSDSECEPSNQRSDEQQVHKRDVQYRARPEKTGRQVDRENEAMGDQRVRGYRLFRRGYCHDCGLTELGLYSAA